MKVLVAMSGGVDSSVAASLLVGEGHDVVGATMKLWGGESDTGCCSVSDVEDARRVAAQLGIDHHVFNFSDDFEDHVVGPYVDAHARLDTPNPCIECNRHIKFDRFLDRALRLGFDAIATGHHARIGTTGDGRWQLLRGTDPAKDQSYVLSMLGQHQLSRTLLPIGAITKSDVRDHARRIGLRTASKPDSQDVCFITSNSGRRGFLTRRITMTPGRIVDDRSGEEIGAVDALEMVTIGQRRGMAARMRGGPAHADRPLTNTRRYVTDVDAATATVLVGTLERTMSGSTALGDVTWTDRPLAPDVPVAAQLSAHGAPVSAVFRAEPPSVRFDEPQRRVAPGQTVALYDGDVVLGAGIALRYGTPVPSPA